MLALMFMGVVAIACAWRPQWGGRRVRSTFAACLAGLVHLGPPLAIFLVVVGSIYAGLATPTEAASLGVMAGLALAWWTGALGWKMLGEALLGTMRSTGMIMLIIVAAYFLNFVMSSIGLTTRLTDTIQNLGLSKWQMLFAVVVFYLILGCFMETLSMMITTIPIVAPVMQALGFDMVWFGIVVIVLIEAALITPPVGLNLFVVQNLRSRGSMNDVIIGSLPFVLAMLLLLLLLAVFPGLALWLPRVMS
jgi:tripartite ATP-independent transporter DctM subunit